MPYIDNPPSVVFVDTVPATSPEWKMHLELEALRKEIAELRKEVVKLRQLLEAKGF